jgi:DNA-binding transcriptional LysR family regulator
MIDWNDLRHFLALERAGTLSRAGAALRINPTTVGRRISALEERIGARLFDRTPDGRWPRRGGRRRRAL